MWDLEVGDLDKNGQKVQSFRFKIINTGDVMYNMMIIILHMVYLYVTKKGNPKGSHFKEKIVTIWGDGS